MTLTERNQKIYELQHKLNMKRVEVKMVEDEIYRVRAEYEMEQRERSGQTLFDDMFGG